MNVLLCGAMGYLIGTLNPAYILGRRKGFDIRRRGLGNAGATNAMLMMGKAVGTLCAMLDILKSFLAYKLARMLFPMLTFAGILAGCACILGHIFPVWMGFSGGKGLACIAGMILADNWKVFLVMLAAEAALALIVNYICVMPLSVSVIYPCVYVVRTGDIVGMLILISLIPVVFYKHLPNLRRIRSGQEARLSWLWNAEKEEERLKARYSESEWKRLNP